MLKTKLDRLIVCMVIFVMVSSSGFASIAITKDSEDFGTYQYEMTVAPDTQDLDANTTDDFNNAGIGSIDISYSGGIATLTPSKSLGSDAANEAWLAMAPTKAGGYTMEFSVKVISETPGKYATGLQAAINGDFGLDWVMVGASSAKWWKSGTVFNTGDNTDGFHVFRVAREAGTDYCSLWRDGVLLSSTLDSSGTGHIRNRMVLGDNTADLEGYADVDYLRFTKGFFPPVPPPSGTLIVIQ